MVKIETDLKLGFDDVLIKPKKSYINSRNDVNLNVNYTFKHSQKTWSGIPIIAANMDTIGTFSMANELQNYNCLTALHKYIDLDEYDTILNYNHTIITIGETIPDDFDKLMLTYDFILVDVANAYRERIVNLIVELRKKFSTKTIIAGNVCTPEMTEELIFAGADIIKCGIGPGSACTTRKIAGVGHPQLSTILECTETAHRLGAHIIADGGCRFAGDIAKAFGAGADFVMLGGMLAGTNESAGSVISEIDQSTGILKQYKEFYGMSSQKAQEKYSEFKNYRASEGKVVKVPYRGKVVNILNEIFGGLRSACTYTNSSELAELSKNTIFYRVRETTNNIFGNSV